jgi:hypothetical protein
MTAQTPLIEETEITEPLDHFLLQVVQTLETAVNQGIKSATDDPSASDKALHDCEYILGTIMAGDVKSWIS